MLNSNGNEEQKVTKKPSGKENETVIVGMEAIQQIKDEYQIEAKGVAHDVNQQDYMVIKAYNNDEKTIATKKNVKEQKEQKEIGE